MGPRTDQIQPRIPLFVGVSAIVPGLLEGNDRPRTALRSRESRLGFPLIYTPERATGGAEEWTAPLEDGPDGTDGRWSLAMTPSPSGFGKMMCGY